MPGVWWTVPRKPEGGGQVGYVRERGESREPPRGGRVPWGPRGSRALRVHLGGNFRPGRGLLS